MAEPNFANRTLYHGDNLDFLRGMNSETVHLIATDPPFNKSRDFHATPDSLARGASFQDRWSWRDDIHDEWLIEIQRDHPEVWSVVTTAKQVYGDDMAAYLCWLGVRLLEMHRVLREDGSIYLHIDHTAHAYVKTLMDAVFGHKNFKNEIVSHMATYTTPKCHPNERTEASLLFWSCKRLLGAGAGVIRRLGSSTKSYCWTLARSARVAAETTVSTPACSRLTT